MAENAVYGLFQQEQLLLHLKCGVAADQVVIAVAVLRALVVVQAHTQ
jgi:hypothetical protein